MMVRKPTKIELKPEDDLIEYEEYKKKQNETNRKNDLKNNLKSEKIDLSNPFKTALANLNDPFQSSLLSNNPVNNTNSSNPYNLHRSIPISDEIDFSNLRNDSPHINQLFSLLLNNLNSNPSFSNNNLDTNNDNSARNNSNNTNNGGMSNFFSNDSN